MIALASLAVALWMAKRCSCGEAMPASMPAASVAPPVASASVVQAAGGVAVGNTGVRAPTPALPTKALRPMPGGVALGGNTGVVPPSLSLPTGAASGSIWAGRPVYLDS